MYYDIIVNRSKRKHFNLDYNYYYYLLNNIYQPSTFIKHNVLTN